MLLRRENLILVSWIQMRQGMKAWSSASRDSRRRTTLHHIGHHRTSLANLRNPRTRYPRMHRLGHSNPRLWSTNGNALTGRVTLSHGMTAVGNSGMAWHACRMRGERLCHTCHHDRGRTSYGHRTSPGPMRCSQQWQVLWQQHRGLGQAVSEELW